MISTIEAVKRTRETATEILAGAVRDMAGKSEKEMRDIIHEGLTTHSELYPDGWYDPPPGGIAVLFANRPFKRLQFETLRDPQFFPSKTSVFGEETVNGMLYLSPVDRATGMIGDIGCTVYRGSDESIRTHIQTCRDLIVTVAEHATVGMSFCDQYRFAMDLFEKNGKKIGWMLTTHDPLKVNLGHTVPGSYGEALPVGGSFDELKEAIRTMRLYTNAEEQFTIPETCAFTLEARLVDMEETMPNVFFHVLVTFEGGKKDVLANFDPIFRAAGMDYML